jgi:sigma-B regulation protein RsbU (phosphoserine phosphatase)
MKTNQLQTTVLLILLTISVLYFGGGVYSFFDTLVHWSDKAAMPFDFGFRGRVFSAIRPEARQAGARRGDTVLELDGAPFTGRSVMRDAVMSRKPGDLLRVKIQHVDGRIVEITIILAPRTKPSLLHWATQFVVQLLMPLFCVLLGFWVVLSRPKDTRAWLLLGMMLGFETLTPTGSWTGFWFTAAIAWKTLLFDSLPIWIMFFGLAFPKPSAFDEKLSWVKWVITILLSGFILEDVWFSVGKQVNFDSYVWFRDYISEAALIRTMLSVAAIGVFFGSLGWKSFMAEQADARRRLRILWWGSAVGLGPWFIVSMFSLATGTDWGAGVPQWVITSGLLILTVFPLTLAHVIVVQREMEVRMVLRIGMKYALAQGGLRFIRTAVGIFALIAFVDAFDDTPNETRLQHFAAAGAGAALLLVRRTLSDRVTLWMDKHFFREAYSSELLLSELSEEARKFIETGPLLETVTKRIAATLHVDRVTVLLRRNGRYSSVSADFPADSKTVRLLRKAERPLLVYFDDADSWVHDASPEEQEALRFLNAQVLLPLSGRDSLLGVMALGPKQSEEPYSPSDLRLLQSVATQTGLTMENSQLFATLASEAVKRERISRELEIAREVQERFFPQKFPEIEGLECAGKCRPALGVGGDYYDFLNLPGGLLGIAIGDVSGKGISAALLMASLRSSLRGQTIGGTTELAGLMSNMNVLVYEASTSSRYATFFYAQYNPTTRQLDYVNAGHNAPLILRGKDLLRLDEGGPVVGLLPNPHYCQATVKLLPDDVFIGFTDGVSEAMNAANEEWSEEAMIETARKFESLGARELIDAIIAEADRFVAGEDQHDDMTLLVMKVLGRG